MKKRISSFLLAVVMLIGLLPTTSFAAGTLEEAMAEVDIYAKNDDLE